MTGSLKVLRLAQGADQIARAVSRAALYALGLALAWTASVLAPDSVIPGGGLAETGEELLRLLTQRIDARPTFQSRPRLLLAALGDRAAALSDALLARRLLAQRRNA